MHGYIVTFLGKRNIIHKVYFWGDVEWKVPLIAAFQLPLAVLSSNYSACIGRARRARRAPCSTKSCASLPCCFVPDHSSGSFFPQRRKLIANSPSSPNPTNYRRLLDLQTEESYEFAFECVRKRPATNLLDSSSLGPLTRTA